MRACLPAVRMDPLRRPEGRRGGIDRKGWTRPLGATRRRTFSRLLDVAAGFINGGEDPAEAAARECLEETGLNVRVTRVLDIISGKEHPRGADFIIVYQAEVIGGELKPDDDADAVEWFGRENLPPLAFRATQKVLESFYA